MSSTEIAIYSTYLFLIAAISGQLDPSSIIVKTQMFTSCIFSGSSNSHLTTHGPYKSTDSRSHVLISLSSFNDSLQSFTTLVSLISLHISQLDAISLYS